MKSNLFCTTFFIFFVVVSANVYSALPTGYEGAQWGISVEALKNKISVVKAEIGSEFGYADHREVDPDVYVHITSENKRIEYYFFQNKLYKIYIVYDRSLATSEFYKQLIKQKQLEFGNAQSHYEENVMGIKVLHVKWEDQHSILDLRNGAGYVFEVMIDKTMQRNKIEILRRRNSI